MERNISLIVCIVLLLKFSVDQVSSEYKATCENKELKNGGEMEEFHCDLKLDSPLFILKRGNISIDAKGKSLDKIVAFTIKNQIVHFMPYLINDYFSHANSITITNTGLKEISYYDLEPFRSVKTLDFSHNSIKKLEKESFRLNSWLEILILNNNEIRSINSGIFKQNSNLRMVDLQENDCISMKIEERRNLEAYESHIRTYCKDMNIFVEIQNLHTVTNQKFDNLNELVKTAQKSTDEIKHFEVTFRTQNSLFKTEHDKYKERINKLEGQISNLSKEIEKVDKNSSTKNQNIRRKVEKSEISFQNEIENLRKRLNDLEPKTQAIEEFKTEINYSKIAQDAKIEEMQQQNLIKEEKIRKLESDLSKLTEVLKTLNSTKQNNTQTEHSLSAQSNEIIIKVDSLMLILALISFCLFNLICFMIFKFCCNCQNKKSNEDTGKLTEATSIDDYGFSSKKSGHFNEISRDHQFSNEEVTRHENCDVYEELPASRLTIQPDVAYEDVWDTNNCDDQYMEVQFKDQNELDNKQEDNEIPEYSMVDFTKKKPKI